MLDIPNHSCKSGNVNKFSFKTLCTYMLDIPNHSYKSGNVNKYVDVL